MSTLAPQREFWQSAFQAGDNAEIVAKRCFGAAALAFTIQSPIANLCTNKKGAALLPAPSRPSRTDGGAHLRRPDLATGSAHLFSVRSL
jgi:hypothetical protein